ncbi:MAG TPA: carboxypeptidase-like regulatory domain-containing protein, partial [Candidatus Ozemobacteraceae bacterium]|nr:carboxypeptidase-like regulatory domain-containing protein [Candidatus Ozemobacteraceae bacterium]
MKATRRGPLGTGILFAFFLLIMVVGCEKGTLGVKGGSISGHVLDSRTLVGLSGVAVTASNGEGDEKDSKLTTSDSQGNYYFNDLRAGEWDLAFDKYGYEPVTAEATGAAKVVVVNNENRQAPEVRMVQVIANQYITIRGTLKDARTGTPITLGTAQFSFGTHPILNNRLPTELQTGLSFPALAGDVDFRIAVTNYKPLTITGLNGAADIDLGVITLEPQSYSIVGVWKDVPGWVFQEKARADIIAYAGNRIVATTTSTLDEQTFTLTGIPIGVSVTIEAQILGYRMNGPIPVTPNGDFQGVIYQPVSLKNNFAQIYRDVRVILVG